MEIKNKIIKKKVLFFCERSLGYEKQVAKNWALELKAARLETAPWEMQFAFVSCWFLPVGLVRPRPPCPTQP